MKHLPELAVVAIIAAAVNAMVTTGHSRVAAWNEADATKQEALPAETTQPPSGGAIASAGVAIDITGVPTFHN